MRDKGYTTPEGFWLSRALLLPDVRTFEELFEYGGEWADDEHARPAPRLVRNGPVRSNAVTFPANEIGPFCTVETTFRKHRSIMVTAKDNVLEAVRPRIVTPDDHLSFKIIEHAGRERALVILQHGYIIGDHWLAYIDPASIPRYPFERRDEVYQGICSALRDDGMEPYVKRSNYEIEVRAIIDHGRGFRRTFHPKLRAVVHADGSVTRTWADGTVNTEPA